MAADFRKQYLTICDTSSIATEGLGRGGCFAVYFDAVFSLTYKFSS